MEECKAAIAQYVDAHGGRVLYADMIDNIPANLRRFVPNALRTMKAEGVMYKQNRTTENGPVFEVFRPAG